MGCGEQERRLKGVTWRGDGESDKSAIIVARSEPIYKYTD
jgi:hypothetical protein